MKQRKLGLAALVALAAYAMMLHGPNTGALAAGAQVANPTMPVTLTREAPAYTFSWQVEEAGESVLEITAASPGTSWDTIGSISAVMKVAVDDGDPFDIVLFMGGEPFKYTVCAGPVSPGLHKVDISFSAFASAPKSESIVVSGIAARVVTPDDPDYQVLAHAPVLFGRYENNYSDVPLLMYHQTEAAADGRKRIVYSMIWSNEDGGTNTAGLITTWGRTTDIEWFYDVTLDAQGRIESEYFQGPNHAKTAFRGRRIGNHPVLRVATDNNNVTDAGQSIFRFGMSPLQQLPNGDSRETMMDRNPWTYKVAALELIREMKQRPGLAPGEDNYSKLISPRQIGDLRNYLFIDFSSILIEARIGFAVKLAGDPDWYGWYPDFTVPGIDRGGRNRIAVELPAGTQAADVVAIQVRTAPKTSGRYYIASLTDIHKAFMLDENYMLGDSLLEWHGGVWLNPGSNSATVWDREGANSVRSP